MARPTENNLDSDLMELQQKNIELQTQNLECRRNLELMRQKMDLQKARILTNILELLDSNSSPDETDVNWSAKDCVNSLNKETDVDALHEQHESKIYSREDVCNNCLAPTAMSLSMLRSAKSTNKFSSSVDVARNAKLDDANHDQCGTCETRTTSPRRNPKTPHHRRRHSPRRQFNTTRTVESACELDHVGLNEQGYSFSAPQIPSAPAAMSTQCQNINQGNTVSPDKSSSVDPESGLSLKERRIIDRPIDSILGKPAMSLYQTFVYAASLKPKHRLIGEIAFQLERRILDYVFGKKQSESKETKKRRFYGYTLKNIETKIGEESKMENGETDLVLEANMKQSLNYVKRILKPLNYDIDFHGDFAEKMVNHYGLLNTSPEKTTIENFGLEDPRVLRVLLSKIINDESVLKHMLVLLDSLCLLSHHDKRPLFLW